MYENEPDVKKVIDTAKGVEGLVRQMGVHAAGVIMSSEPHRSTTPRSGSRHTDGVDHHAVGLPAAASRSAC